MHKKKMVKRKILAFAVETMGVCGNRTQRCLPKKMEILIDQSEICVF